MKERGAGLSRPGQRRKKLQSDAREAEWGCARCGGLKVAERFYTTDATASMWSYEGFRCLNCGAISVEEPLSVT